MLLPIGTPASQPEPLCCAGVLGLVDGLLGVGVLGCVDGFVDGCVLGFVLGAELELCSDDELDAAELLVGATAVPLVGADVGVGAGVLGEDEEEAAVGDVLAPAAACCTASAAVFFDPPEPDEHPVTPSATAPATAMKTPPFPAPEVLMLVSTPERHLALRRGRGENPLVIEAAVGRTTSGNY